MTDFSGYRLGESGGEIALLDRADNRRASTLLAAQARLSLELYTRDLDPLLFDTGDFLDAVRQLALNGRRSLIRVLLQDSTLAIKRGHGIVRLAQRLSSFIEIRQPHTDYRDFNQAFLLADRRGYIHRLHADRYQGSADFNGPLKARELGNFFDEVWEKSHPDPELRQFHI